MLANTRVFSFLIVGLARFCQRDNSRREAPAIVVGCRLSAFKFDETVPCDIEGPRQSRLGLVVVHIGLAGSHAG